MSVYDKPLPSSAGLYHKFEDKVTYKFRLLSEPIVYVSEYKGTESTKYAFVAWNMEDSALQLIKLPKTAAEQIWKLANNEDYGDPTTYDLKITRTGDGFDTKYDIQPRPQKSDTPQEALDAYKKIDPIGLLSKGQGTVDVYWLSEAEDGEAKPRAASQPAPVDTSNLPIDENPPAPDDPKGGDEEEPW